MQAPGQPQAHILARHVALDLTASITLRPRQRAPGARHGRLTNLYRQCEAQCQTASSSNVFWCPVVWRAAADLSMERWRGAALTSVFMHEFVACASVSKPPTPATILRTLFTERQFRTKQPGGSLRVSIGGRNLFVLLLHPFQMTPKPAGRLMSLNA